MKRKCQFYEWVSSREKVRLRRKEYRLGIGLHEYAPTCYLVLCMWVCMWLSVWQLRVYCISTRAWSVQECIPAGWGGGACLLHPSQGHLSIQWLWVDLHQHSICIFPDDAAVLVVVVVVSVAATATLSLFSFHSPVMWALCEVKENLTCKQNDPDFCHLQEPTLEPCVLHLHSPQASMTVFICSVAGVVHLRVPRL